MRRRHRWREEKLRYWGRGQWVCTHPLYTFLRRGLIGRRCWVANFLECRLLTSFLSRLTSDHAYIDYGLRRLQANRLLWNSSSRCALFLSFHAYPKRKTLMNSRTTLWMPIIPLSNLLLRKVWSIKASNTTVILSTLLARYGDFHYPYSVLHVASLSQDEYSPINSQYAIGIHGYILVYSIASRSSFDMIQIVYDKIIDFSGLSELPCVVVGTKVDLAPTGWVSTYNTFHFLFQLPSLRWS